MARTIASSIERPSVGRPIPSSVANFNRASAPAELFAHASSPDAYSPEVRRRDPDRSGLSRIPVIGRVAAQAVAHLRHESDHSSRAEAIGIDGWTGPLDAPIEWKAANYPAGKRETWGPMLSWGLPFIGNKKENHWAAGGCLQKLDQISGGDSQAYQSKHRRRGLIDVAKMAVGYWDAFNAGHCNQEAMREGALKDPVHSVTREVVNDRRHRSPGFVLRTFCGSAGEVLGEPLGAIFPKETVTFTTTDIKLLCMLVMEDLVVQDRNSQYQYDGFRNSGSKQKEGRGYDARFDPEEPYPHDVIETVCKKWGQQERRGIIGDKKPGKLLDNRLFDSGSVEHLAKPPMDFDRTRVPEGGTVKFYAIKFECSQQLEDSVHLQAWVHTDAEGKQTSGWIHEKENVLKEKFDHAGNLLGVIKKKPSNYNVDFFWVPNYQEGIFERPWTGFATSCNPKVDKFAVWTLYQESIGNNWAEQASRPEFLSEVRAHLANAEKQGRYVAPLRAVLEETVARSSAAPVPSTAA